jgi:hypothetical protein
MLPNGLKAQGDYRASFRRTGAALTAPVLLRISHKTNVQGGGEADGGAARRAEDADRDVGSPPPTASEAARRGWR